jgi:ABC-type glycerol-3-phosphate transport system permease component
MKRKRGDLWIHAVLIVIAVLTLLPFFFVLNNSLRTNAEMDYSFFGFPNSVKRAAAFTWYEASGQKDRIELRVVDDDSDEFKGRMRVSDIRPRKMSYGEAMGRLWSEITRGYKFAWTTLRPYMLNTFLVCGSTALGVIAIGSITAYVFSRYRFPGHRFVFTIVLSFMMIPAVLTLVPSFMLMKKLGLLNSYWVLILPYVAGGQIFAIFLLKGFFDALPGELFESARLDGAGHWRLYWHIVLPLARPILSVVAIVNVLGAWNNFMWPFITNTDQRYHVVASGLFLMGNSDAAANHSTMFAGYVLASVPLLVLFAYSTKPFIAGITSGAFKA